MAKEKNKTEQLAITEPQQWSTTQTMRHDGNWASSTCGDKNLLNKMMLGASISSMSLFTDCSFSVSDIKFTRSGAKGEDIRAYVNRDFGPQELVVGPITDNLRVTSAPKQFMEVVPTPPNFASVLSSEDMMAFDGRDWRKDDRRCLFWCVRRVESNSGDTPNMKIVQATMEAKQTLTISPDVS